jgi:hypothetical protein
MERINLQKINEVKGREKYCVEVPNRFADLEDLNGEMDISKTIAENIKFQPKRVEVIINSTSIICGLM